MGFGARFSRACGRPVVLLDRDSEQPIVTSNTSAIGHQPRKVLVLLANEPSAYRESIAAVFRQLRPNVEVITAEPEELEARILALTPNMVICSEATSVVRERVSVWVELYPDYGSSSVVGIEGRRTTIEEIQLSDLPSILDSAERLAQKG